MRIKNIGDTSDQKKFNTSHWKSRFDFGIERVNKFKNDS